MQLLGHARASAFRRLKVGMLQEILSVSSMKPRVGESKKLLLLPAGVEGVDSINEEMISMNKESCMPSTL